MVQCNRTAVHNATPDDKEECFGRATVALTRAIQHTYLSAVTGRHGRASWNGSDVGSIPYRVLHLAAWPYGAMLVPDAAAILEWGLDDPFIPQDRPALSIAMLTTMNGKGSCILQFVSLFLLTVVAAESFNSFDFVRLYFVALWGGASPSASVAVSRPRGAVGIAALLCR